MVVNYILRNTPLDSLFLNLKGKLVGRERQREKGVAETALNWELENSGSSPGIAINWVTLANDFTSLGLRFLKCKWEVWAGWFLKTLYSSLWIPPKALFNL